MGVEAEAHLPGEQHLPSSGRRCGSAGCAAGGFGPAAPVPSRPGSRGHPESPWQPCRPGKQKAEVSVATCLPVPTGHQGPRTRNVIVKAGLRLLTEACWQVSGAVGPGSPAPQGAFWPGSRSPHSAEPGARGGAQRADPESPLAPKIKVPILTQGWAVLPSGRARKERQFTCWGDAWGMSRGRGPSGRGSQAPAKRLAR